MVPASADEKSIEPRRRASSSAYAPLCRTDARAHSCDVAEHRGQTNLWRKGHAGISETPRHSALTRAVRPQTVCSVTVLVAPDTPTVTLSCASTNQPLVA